MTAVTPLQDASRERRERTSRFWLGLVVGLIPGALLALGATWAVTSNASVQTDMDNGRRFADLVDNSPERFHDASASYPLAPICQAAAEAFYGAAMFDGEITASSPNRPSTTGAQVNQSVSSGNLTPRRWVLAKRTAWQRGAYFVLAAPFGLAGRPRLRLGRYISLGIYPRRRACEAALEAAKQPTGLDASRLRPSGLPTPSASPRTWYFWCFPGVSSCLVGGRRGDVARWRGGVVFLEALICKVFFSWATLWRFVQLLA